MNVLIRNFLIMFTLVLTACNTTKFVSDGKYLLDKTSIKTDVKNVDKSLLESYLRQTPNAAVFGLFRMQLGIYNLAPTDSSKWLSRTLKRIGDPPVLYDPTLTAISRQQLQLFFQNKGYINAKVESDVTIKGKKAMVVYKITSNKPYRLRNMSIDLKNDQLAEVAADSTKSMIRKRMLFDTDILNAERERISYGFRKLGYYNFGKDYLSYSADSALNSNQIDLTMELRPYLQNQADSAARIVFRKFHINRVLYYINNEASPTTEPQSKLQLDTLSFRNFYLITPKERFLKLDALVQNTFVNPGNLYSDEAVERTYQALNTLGPIKYVNISFRETDNSKLDCIINIVPAKTISISTEAEGTYTAGYWGIGSNISYVDRNRFKGAEALSIQGRAAIEWQKDVLAQEFGAQAGLRFPRFMLPVGSYDFKRNIHANTEFTASFGYQFRPGEFTTTNAGAGTSYTWNRQQFRHNVQLFELSYVQFPLIDANFRERYLNSGKYNRYNYTDHLILRTGYSGSHSSFNSFRPLQDYSSSRYNFEMAGNLLYGVSKLFDLPKVGDAYQIFKVRYSQYIKGEYNFTRHRIFDPQSRLVYHLGLGLGIPYGNADVIPFEKRFYSGGANSVRGWGESQLGPGTYKRIVNSSRDFNQVGDVKLDLSLEYRAKLFWLLEGALFVDAGNVWTIKNYETQPGGEFKFNTFSRQIGLAYGTGLRFDFSFFIARIDLGVKLFDPARESSLQWRTKPNFGDDFALHFAIGYPF